MSPHLGQDRFDEHEERYRALRAERISRCPKCGEEKWRSFDGVDRECGVCVQKRESLGTPLGKEVDDEGEG